MDNHAEHAQAKRDTLVNRLRTDADAIEKMRRDLLFDRDDYEDIPNGKIAYHFIQATSFLGLAQTALKLAAEEVE